MYSKNEHETAAEWVIMQMMYVDDYERRAGRWYFRRRLPLYWYATDLNKPPLGRKIRVVFKDGETLVGVTPGYHPARPGFFLLPADADCNTERCFVVAGSAQSVNLV